MFNEVSFILSMSRLYHGKKVVDEFVALVYETLREIALIFKFSLWIHSTKWRRETLWLAPCVFSPLSPFIDRCNTSFDAVARIRGETFFFKGLKKPEKWLLRHVKLENGQWCSTIPYLLRLLPLIPPGLTMWRVNGGGLVSGRGASVRRLWRGLPPDLPPLHAVLERQSDHAIIFINGIFQ